MFPNLDLFAHVKSGDKRFDLVVLLAPLLDHLIAFKVLFVVIDKSPSDSGWMEIGTLRADNVQIIPIDDTVIQHGCERQREREELDSYLRRFLGRRLFQLGLRFGPRVQVLPNGIANLQKGCLPIADLYGCCSW